MKRWWDATEDVRYILWAVAIAVALVGVIAVLA